MPRYKALFLAGIFTLAISLAALAHADDDVDSQARIVRISSVEGQVRIDSGHGYRNATINVPITEGNWLETGPDGWAEVQLEDGSTIRLAPETQIVFYQLARLSSGDTATTIDLDQGEAEFKISKRHDSEFEVTVNKKTIILDQSGRFRVTSTNSDPLEIAVWSGSVGVKDTDSGGTVDILRNETFLLDAQDLSRYALDKGVEADDLDQWSKERDDYLSTYASSASRYAQSPYQYGVNDLDQYGQYTDVPGYGYVWQPNGVGPDWDPYSNGYWSYSPVFGNYWVSSYPWGWMPFRYGNWIFVRARGWCWQPSAPGGWTKWHRTPRLVNAPPGFHPPASPGRQPEMPRAPGRIDRDHGHNTIKGGGGDVVPQNPPGTRRPAPGRIDGDHGHNTIGGGGGDVAPQNPPDTRRPAPGRIDGDHGHNTIGGGGGDVAPQNPPDTRRPAPGRIDGDHGHNTISGGGVDPQNTDQRGGGGLVKRRTFTNEDVQTTPPPASVPPTPVPPTPAQPGYTPMERRDHGNGVARSTSGVDAAPQGAAPKPVVTVPVQTQVEHTRFSGPAQEQHTAPTPPPPQVRQYTPPPVQQAPPVRQYTPPPPVQQAPPARQFTPPPAPQPKPASPVAEPKQTDTDGRQRPR